GPVLLAPEGPSIALDDWNMILCPSRSLGLMFAFDCSVDASVLNDVCRPCMPLTRLNCVSWLKKLDGSIGCEGSCERSCVAIRRRKSLCVRSLPLVFAACCCAYAEFEELRIELMSVVMGFVRYLPSSSVLSINCLALFMTSTSFWYAREAEIMFTSSSTGFTFGVNT